MEPRQWQIVFHLHGDRTATVHVHVNGRLLMPGCAGLPIDEALGYVAAALVDCHPSDRLSLRTQGSVGSIRSIRPTDATRGQIWLRDRVAELARALELHAESAPTDDGNSGLRPGLRQQEQAHSERLSRSNS